MKDSVLSASSLTLPTARLGPENPLPPVAPIQNGQQQTRAKLDEDDGLFIGYGFVPTIFPYRQQDAYQEPMVPTPIDTLVLENRFLRAEFLPGYGGRLRSLFDKEQGRELLYKNPVIRPRNLAVRDAWLAGGVEWNCGVVGHSPLTCEPLFTAQTQLDDGTPVLRMYAFERIRAVVYQMDFFLPADSRLLFARMRITNPGKAVIPMYWWSNIAVPEDVGSRVLVDASAAYSSIGGTVMKVPVPEYQGKDITYPTRSQDSIDYFWKVPEKSRKYVCHLDQTGYGLCQFSTSRLQGRKLFVWGQSRGSDHWQRFLTAPPDDGRYVEIQAGLAKTQYECLPMPPETTWEWLEAYGPLQADPAAIHGAWPDAIHETQKALGTLMPEAALEKLLEDTHAMATSPAATLLFSGDGWGALERLRRERDQEKPFCNHLDFGHPGELQKPWLALLETGAFNAPEGNPRSWMLQKPWLDRLARAIAGPERDNAAACLQLGAACLADERFNDAEALLRHAHSLAPEDAYTSYTLGHTMLRAGNPEAPAWFTTAADAKPEEAAFAIPAMYMLLETANPDDALRFYDARPAPVRASPRMQMYRCDALIKLGRFEEAEQILNRLIVPNIREGELSLTQLWLSLKQAQAEAAGQPFDPAQATPPEHLEFRVKSE